MFPYNGLHFEVWTKGRKLLTKVLQSDAEIIVEELNKMADKFRAQGRQSLEGRVKELEAEVAGIYSQCPGCQRLEAEVKGLKSQLAASRGTDKWEKFKKEISKYKDKPGMLHPKDVVLMMEAIEASLEAGAPEGEK
jgi:hypothetical protein